MLLINKLEELRKSLNLSQEKFANMIGITKNGWQNIVNNEDLKISLLLKIAETFNVKITYFFETEENNTSQNGQENEKADLSKDQLKDELIASYRTTIESQQEQINMLKKELAFFNTEAQYKNKQAG